MGIFPPIQKHRKKRKRKGEEKKSYLNIVYILFNITGGGLLALFDDELTTFWNNNYRFICIVGKIEKA